MTQCFIRTNGNPEELPNESWPKHVICERKRDTADSWPRVSSVEKRVRNWEFEKGDSSSYPIQNLLTKDDVSDDTISGQRCHLVLGEAQPGAGQQLKVGVSLLTLSPACSLVLTLDLRSLVEEQRNCSILKLQSFQQCITVSTWGLGYSLL